MTRGELFSHSYMNRRNAASMGIARTVGVALYTSDSTAGHSPASHPAAKPQPGEPERLTFGSNLPHIPRRNRN
jgi:hypothetical protein